MGEGALVACPGRGRPLLLAVETATQVMSVAVMRGDRVLAELERDDPRPHSERLLPGIDEVLTLAGVALAGIEAIAISIGPGSFTGLRVGLATVKGLALCGGPPIVAVPTLAALALVAAPAPGPVAALIDARRGEVYAAGWKDPAAPDPGADRAMLDESVYTPAELAVALAKAGGAWTLVAGEGGLDSAQRVAEGGGARLFCFAEVPARAARVGLIASRLLTHGAGGPAGELVPRYVRRAEAEVRRTGAKLESESSK